MASQLKAAEFALPGWASGRQRSRQRASRRASRARASRFFSDLAPTNERSVAPGHDGRRRAAKDPRLNLNQASFAELRSLNLTTTQSHRLLAYRKRVGGYESLEQLDEVPGFPNEVRERLKRQADHLARARPANCAYAPPGLA